ncbi:hypothetical protein H5P28_11680 [Ruficoccus amylovorans]|uniref:Uncharacterized protein n=1 Tax=Ruficoccus amylovorans TaxID=1804625 RepID=A0A842HFV6_9BACT|nr:hypothetical protein [Ruficoccus amylovorans]MBC2594918.1 hypothetical protein [Ruficoccus amylovorans]
MSYAYRQRKKRTTREQRHAATRQTDALSPWLGEKLTRRHYNQMRLADQREERMRKQAAILSKWRSRFGV